MGMTQTGCSDFLEVEPLNQIVFDKFWNEKADVDGIIAGCYSAMQDENIVKRMMIWGEFRSDNIAIGRNIDQDANLEKVLKENIDAKNSYTKWEGFYNIINRCNTVIKYAPGVAAADLSYTQSELNANIAEMVGLRSLCYFYLIRAFRDVPFTREAYTDDTQKMDLPATKFEDVLDSLIYDLESVKGQAVKRYPTSKPLYQTGRISQDAIYAMLCEMYLWKKDYQNCIKYADLVIESKKLIAKELRSTAKYKNSSSGNTSQSLERFNGFPLISGNISSNYYGNAYSKLFGYDDYVDEYNQEIIFQLVFDDNPLASGMMSNQAVSTFYGNNTNSIGLVAPADFILEEIASEAFSSRKVFSPSNKLVDARLYENCNQANSSINKFTTRSIEIDATRTEKVGVSYYSLYSDKDVGSNWVIYRLTDIMLLKAEALTQMLQEGSTQEVIDYNTPILDQAFWLVNAVNKRSVCETTLVDTLVRTDYGTKSQMETLVYQERQRELMFEGKRWFDLVRISQREGNTQTLTAAALLKASMGGSVIANKLTKMDAIYWPYNYDELKVNLKLKQNPAFSSGENDSYAKNY
jgi:hypothetical protein